MSDPVDLSKLAPRDALEFAIGRYVTTFANLETILATHIGYVLGLDHNLVFFILKDVFLDIKVKLLRRSVQQKFGCEKSEAYCILLNKVDKIGQSRNSLLHGSFAQEGDENQTQLRGRLGETLTKFDAGLKEIGYTNLQEAARAINEVAAALISALPEVDDSPSSSSSREQSGSGDQ